MTTKENKSGVDVDQEVLAKRVKALNEELKKLPGGMPTFRRRREDPTGTGRSARLEQDEYELATASLSELVEALVPAVSLLAIARLEQLIRDAQENPPEDRQGFVRDVNRILDAHNLRIRVDGHALTRLALTPSSVLGSIQFTGPGVGTQGFRNREVEVVPAPDGYLQRGRPPKKKKAVRTDPGV